MSFLDALGEGRLAPTRYSLEIFFKLKSRFEKIMADDGPDNDVPPWFEKDYDDDDEFAEDHGKKPCGRSPSI